MMWLVNSGCNHIAPKLPLSPFTVPKLAGLSATQAPPADPTRTAPVVPALQAHAIRSVDALPRRPRLFDLRETMAGS